MRVEKMKNVLACLLLSLFVSPVFATEPSKLTENELSEVLSGAITLKANCNAKGESACKEADAVMKLLRYSLKSKNSPHKAYMTTYGGIALDAFIDGYMQIKAVDITKPIQ
jgi:hypothetical protein